MQAFVINLEGATDRWASVERTFAPTNCRPVRVPAVNGTLLTLPVEGFSEPLFQRYHGRTTNLREVGCYLSHVAACRRFLETEDPFGLICEDDVSVIADLPPLWEALGRCSRHWDLVRLSGIGLGHPVRALALGEGRELMVNFGRLKGAGAYLVNRRAAAAIAERFLPMRVPFDHEIDREWVYGLRACSVQPFPLSQTETGFRTSIQKGPSGKLPRARRWLTTYPYQLRNELSRYLMRAWSYLRIRAEW